MSLLIKGMEMPKNCGECRLNTMYGLPFACDGWCFAMSSTEPNNKSLATKTRPPHCPLVELPPHGRLIDADAYEQLLYSLGCRDYRREKGSIKDAIKFLHSNYAPTIIEAEEDE